VSADPLLLAALLGVVQGLTEFLPVSSTAHLLIGGWLAGGQDPAFTIMIQLGSILAVMWLYRARIAAVVAGLRSSPAARRFVLMLLAAFAPAVVAGAGLDGIVGPVLYESPGVIATTLVAGGIVILVVERLPLTPVVRDAAETPLGRAFGIGVCQAVALVPGVSRAAATIVGGRLLGLDRAAAAEFSFFLAMPTMTAAFVYGLVDVRAELTPGRGAEIAVGFVMAFVAALAVVRPFLRFVARSGFAPFAWYRIALGVGVVAAMGAGWL
jgi:undecaprenyl-diphosphatase